MKVAMRLIVPLLLSCITSSKAAARQRQLIHAGDEATLLQEEDSLWGRVLQGYATMSIPPCPGE